MNRAETFSGARLIHLPYAQKFSALYNVLGWRSSLHKLTEQKSVNDVILRGGGALSDGKILFEWCDDCLKLWHLNNNIDIFSNESETNS